MIVLERMLTAAHADGIDVQVSEAGGRTVMTVADRDGCLARLAIETAGADADPAIKHGTRVVVRIEVGLAMPAEAQSFRGECR